MLRLNESYKSRLKLLAGIIKEADYATKANLLSKSNERVPFNAELMKQAIDSGREIGLSFKSSNDKYVMPVSKMRVVRPMVMGSLSNGAVAIRGFHILGQSEKKAIETGKRSAEAENEWRLFKAENIKGMWFTGRFFNDSPPGYKPNDRQFSNISASFNPSKAKNIQNKLAQQSIDVPEEPEVRQDPQQEPQQNTQQEPQQDPRSVDQDTLK